jgi:DNA topoisomerase-1
LNISSVALEKARDFISKEFGKDYLPVKTRVYKTQSKVAQEAHEAIRPTDVWVKTDKVDVGNKKFISDAKTLYNLIRNRFIATQMKDSVYDETSIDVGAYTKSDTLNPKYLLRISGQVMKFDGWRKIIPYTKEEAPVLPKVEKGEALDLVKVASDQKFTQPPSRFNEASLIKTLEKLGIGRPSTYAPIISTIQVRQYVEKDEGKFFPTPVGIAVNDFLIGNFPDVFEYNFTAGMEDDLDKVAGGQRKWQEMMKEFYKPFEKKLEVVEKKSKRIEIETEKLGKKCPKCKKGNLVIRIGRFGKFVSCDQFPDCDYKEKYLDKLNIKCPTCKKGEIIVKTTRRGKKFYGCSRYPDCKWASWKKPEVSGKK